MSKRAIYMARYGRMMGNPKHPLHGTATGYRYGDGNGSGYGSGNGGGRGYGNGNGSGRGYGDGNGDGRGSGDGVKSIRGLPVSLVDGVQTAIYRVFGNAVKGAILGSDLSLEPCYVVKDGSLFAHGKTIEEAREALRLKIFDSMPIEEKIKDFMADHELGIPYSNKEWYEWHHLLTGSCKAGRDAFMRDHGITLDGEMTVSEFIALTRESYGADVILALEKAANGMATAEPEEGE